MQKFFVRFGAFLSGVALTGIVLATSPLMAEQPGGGGDYGVIESGVAAGSNLDLDGTGKLILDADGDTYWDSTADDRPTLTIEGVERLQLRTADNSFRFAADSATTSGFFLVGDNSTAQAWNIDFNASNAAFNFGVSSSYGRQFNFVDGANGLDDYNVATPTNPEFRVFSATAAATATDEWVMLSHDTDNAIIDAGKGGLMMPKQEGTTVAAPDTCDANAVGVFQYVDDTNDSAAAQICVCIATGDDGAGAPNAFDWRKMDDLGTACGFF